MSTPIERLNLVIEELGPSTEAIVLIEQAAPRLWLVVMEDDSVIGLRLDEDRGTLTLSCELGRPQDAVKHRVHEALLSYNGLSDLHGGVRMALREPGGPVVQEFDIQVASLQTDEFRALILDFCRKASAWEEIIESAEPEELDEALHTETWRGLRV